MTPKGKIPNSFVQCAYVLSWVNIALPHVCLYLALDGQTCAITELVQFCLCCFCEMVDVFFRNSSCCYKMNRILELKSHSQPLSRL